MLRIISIVAVLVTLAAAETAKADYIADNHTWIVSCNSSGYALKSKFPVSRFIEAGVSSSSTEAIETLYLGKACDASHKLFGKGKWCQANGGFRATLAKHEFGFPRQELMCPDANDTGADCPCR